MLMNLGQRDEPLPAGYRETFRKVLHRVVAYLDSGAANEATIRKWAATHREQMGKPEWLFPANVPPELLEDVRELARLVAAIDIGKERGGRAMLDALGAQDDPALVSHVARKDGASKGGKAKADKYKEYVPDWRKWVAELKEKNAHMSDDATYARVARLHETTYENSDNPNEVKKVSKRTIRNHLASDQRLYRLRSRFNFLENTKPFSCCAPSNVRGHIATRRSVPMDKDITPRALTIDAFCRVYPIGRSTLYRLIKAKVGPRTMKIGRRTLISVEAAEEWVRRMEQATADA